MANDSKLPDVSLSGILRYFVNQINNNLLIGIICLFVLAAIAYFLTPRNQTSSTGGSKSHSVEIYREFYHMGDVTLDKFSHQVPQANPFQHTFQVNDPNAQAVLRLTERHIDPDGVHSPASVFINGKFVGLLNDYVHEETFDPRRIEMPIPPGILQYQNTILIVNGIEIDHTYKNVDDFEFSELSIEFK
jgi:hypothetical protein